MTNTAPHDPLAHDPPTPVDKHTAKMFADIAKAHTPVSLKQKADMVDVLANAIRQAHDLEGDTAANARRDAEYALAHLDSFSGWLMDNDADAVRYPIVHAMYYLSFASAWRDEQHE